MKRAAAAVVLFVSASAWSASASPSAAACAGGRTLARDGVARVYSSSAGVYGCAFHTGRPWKLGSARICNLTPCAAEFALAGTVVAYGLNRFGVDTGSTTVVVRRLLSGRVVHEDAATSTGVVEGYGSVASLVVKSDGSDAWIGTSTSIIGHGRVVEVHRHDRRGTARLDAGGSIEPGSLRLHRSALMWRDGGATRHSTLR